jgi:hypothetical protein
MDRPGKFEHSRWLGDKRTQVVYDVDNLTDEDAHLVEDLMAAEAFACFRHAPRGPQPRVQAVQGERQRRGRRGRQRRLIRPTA